MTFSNTVPMPASPYRKRIWAPSAAYDFTNLSLEQLHCLSVVYAMFAAKLNIPFPTPTAVLSACAAIAELLALPESTDPEPLREPVSRYMKLALSQKGFGFATAICLLAVLSHGRYAPIDRKNIAGMAKLQIVTREEASILIRKDLTAWIEVYLGKVMPAWWVEQRTLSPEEIDCKWGRARLD